MSTLGSGLGGTVYVEPQFREGGSQEEKEGVQRKREGMEQERGREGGRERGRERD